MGTIIKYNNNNCTIINNAKRFPFITIILGILLIIFLGFRPPTYDFADTGNYAYLYEHFSIEAETINFKTEWLWNTLINFCQTHQLSVKEFFFIVELVYIGSMVICCWIFFPNNTWLGFLFFLTSFSFYAYSINGIRNGMATSLLLLAICLSCNNKKIINIIGGIICILATGIHKTSILPIMTLIFALFFVKKPKHAIYFWITSIIISLISGNYIGNIFASLGFDDRMSEYLNNQENVNKMAQFSQTGFRFDFLLYSAMPVLMTWYVTIKRRFEDKTYNIIAITYILANSFWIMVIRASFSNRFAYLSWFIYPLVIAYPLLNFKIWDDQDKKTAQILFYYEGFTFFMFIIGKL